jgi:hypothetical protein
LINFSELGRSLNLTHNTIKKYLDILAGTFMIRLLQPWHANITKRQVKTPKLYIRDTGLLHYLLDIQTITQLEGHPKLGASWEGWALEQLLSSLSLPQEESFFWNVHQQAELDLLLLNTRKQTGKLGIEFKYGDRIIPTRSMYTAIETLELTALWCIYPGEHIIPLAKNIWAYPLSEAICALQ